MTGSEMKTSTQAIPTDFERIFHPHRLALVGVSAEEGGVSFGSVMFRAITAMRFEGEIFPVNPKGGTIAGQNIYKKVEDIPGTLDYAIIAVAARLVPEVLEACRKKVQPAPRYFLPGSAS